MLRNPFLMRFLRIFSPSWIAGCLLLPLDAKGLEWPLCSPMLRREGIHHSRIGRMPATMLERRPASVIKAGPLAPATDGGDSSMLAVAGSVTARQRAIAQ